MDIILVLIPVSLVVACGFLAAFIWAMNSGQYEDTETPSMRLLAEDDPLPISNVTIDPKSPLRR
jgi:cbb3-type cytochrome oxidase maturation protein